ncbi:ribokinase [Sporolactobacillus vineae]|uniref:ribokinase n=1 Tax=Sporolactobacillus vineae TaxID=444463 RepID=UPI00028A1FFD|nr:ribokinase [Sporolactobacillus vineae]
MKPKPTLTIIGQQLFSDEQLSAFSTQTKNIRSRGITVVEQPDWLVVLIHGTDHGMTQPDIGAAGKWITRSRVILLLLDVPVGIIRRVTRLAHRRAKILVDPAPALALSEKIQRAIRLFPAAQRRFRKRSLRSYKNRKFKR